MTSRQNHQIGLVQQLRSNRLPPRCVQYLICPNLYLSKQPRDQRPGAVFYIGFSLNCPAIRTTAPVNFIVRRGFNFAFICRFLALMLSLVSFSLPAARARLFRPFLRALRPTVRRQRTDTRNTFHPRLDQSPTRSFQIPFRSDFRSHRKNPYGAAGCL